MVHRVCLVHSFIGPLFLQLDLILLSGNGFASSTEILNLADQLKPKKMKKMEVEQVLQQLVQKKWLCEVGKGLRGDRHITTSPAQGGGRDGGLQG